MRLIDSKELLLDYTTTNDSGYYSISLNLDRLSDSLKLVASFLGYHSQQKILLSKKSEYDFILKKKSESLDEVIIKVPTLPFFSIQKDTIKYNLKKNLTGQESDLGEVLNNLPGIRINNGGKIEVNGKVIDNLLINGESFFENQHQIATKNITAEMIEGVSFFKKYRDFTNVSETEASLGTAINIDIKQEFKKKFKGSIDFSKGFINSYSAKGILYNFSNKTNITIITDWNSINESSISPRDFFDLISPQIIGFEMCFDLSKYYYS